LIAIAFSFFSSIVRWLFDLRGIKVASPRSVPIRVRRYELGSPAYQKLLRDYLAPDPPDIMSPTAVLVRAEQMERAQARRLQPHFIGAFFREAFTASNA
jgi:hypothetical protein